MQGKIAQGTLLFSSPPPFGAGICQRLDLRSHHFLSNHLYRPNSEPNPSSPSRQSSRRGHGYHRPFSSTTTTKAATKKLFSPANVRCGYSATLQETDVPLVLVPGLKGTHLSFMANEEDRVEKKKVWLSLGGLFNFPPRPDDHPERCIALPLTYTDGVQDRGRLFADGTVDHVIELGMGDYGNGVIPASDTSFDFFPFYGHATQHLREMNERYHRRRHQNDPPDPSPSPSPSPSHNTARPTSVFSYDWRRSLNELSAELHRFCETTYPETPVQIVAHSLGGLLTFDAMRTHPQKYAPGAVLVGVPFGTGIQYLEDMHRGYFTELNRCRQFTPADQFTFSSHWSFFPVSGEELGDTFVDVTASLGGGGEVRPSMVPFKPDVSAIGKVNADTPFQPNAIEGDIVDIDFYDVEEWQRNEIGIFNPENRGKFSMEDIRRYKEHMKIQLEIAKKWRQTALSPVTTKNEPLPPLVVCATNTIPTINQILRRKREGRLDDEGTIGILQKFIGGETLKDQNMCSWEYDYSSGRSVPGDGRIDFDKAFPKGDIPFKRVSLNSLHAKQMVWEDQGGSWGEICDEVVKQLQLYDGVDSKMSYVKK